MCIRDRALSVFEDLLRRKGMKHREVFSAAVNYGACLVDEDSKNAQARAEAKAALEAKHSDEWLEFEERAEAKRTSARKTKLIDKKKGRVHMEKVLIEIAQEEKELRKKHWDELIVTKWGRAAKRSSTAFLENSSSSWAWRSRMSLSRTARPHFVTINSSQCFFRNSFSSSAISMVTFSI